MKTMSALIAALYPDHATADRVRVRLSTGDTAFPTDRVHLTSSTEPGHAGLVPAASFPLKLQAYFHTLFDRDDEKDRVRALSGGVHEGHAVIAVFPRGDIEIKQARELLRQAKPLQVFEHDMDEQTLEHAASESDAAVVSKVTNAIPGSNRKGK
jgi:hypothetical protein